MIMKSSVFFAVFGYADITPPAPRVQIRKAFSQSFDKRFFRMLLSVIRKRYEIVPTIKICLAAESFLALPDIAHFTSEILFDEVFDIGQFDTVIVDKFIFDILLLSSSVAISLLSLRQRENRTMLQVPNVHVFLLFF